MTFNDLIAKIGQDKVLHFLVGSLITAVVTLIAGLQEPTIGWGTINAPILGLVVTAFFAVIKEAVIDIVFDWRDFIATLAGAIPIFISTVIGILFHILST